jgi:hypothetical protein
VSADEINHCRVLVAFCSPAFISSSFCGKEVHLFQERLKVWKAENPRARAKFFIPVLWFKTDKIPHALLNHQFFPLPQNDFGTIPLKEICQFDSNKEHRTRIINELADVIKKGWDQGLPPRANALVSFADIPNAFETASDTLYSVAVICRPDGDGELAQPKLERYISQAAGPALHFECLNPGTGFEERVRKFIENRGVFLIVADHAFLTRDEFREARKVMDLMKGEHTELIVVSDQAGAAGLAKTAFKDSFANFPQPRFLMNAERELVPTLSLVIEKLRGPRIDKDKAATAASLAIQDEARGDGVPINRKPNIGGPEVPQ